jgi:hypothetical protein
MSSVEMAEEVAQKTIEVSNIQEKLETIRKKDKGDSGIYKPIVMAASNMEIKVSQEEIESACLEMAAKPDAAGYVVKDNTTTDAKILHHIAETRRTDNASVTLDEAERAIKKSYEELQEQDPKEFECAVEASQYLAELCESTTHLEGLKSKQSVINIQLSEMAEQLVEDGRGTPGTRPTSVVGESPGPQSRRGSSSLSGSIEDVYARVTNTVGNKSTTPSEMAEHLTHLDMRTSGRAENDLRSPKPPTPVETPDALEKEELKQPSTPMTPEDILSHLNTMAVVMGKQLSSFCIEKNLAAQSSRGPVCYEEGVTTAEGERIVGKVDVARDALKFLSTISWGAGDDDNSDPGGETHGLEEEVLESLVEVSSEASLKTSGMKRREAATVVQGAVRRKQASAKAQVFKEAKLAQKENNLVPLEDVVVKEDKALPVPQEDGIQKEETEIGGEDENGDFDMGDMFRLKTLHHAPRTFNNAFFTFLILNSSPK